MELSSQDKLNLAGFLGTATVGLVRAQAALPLAKDDGLRKLLTGSIAATEAQIKSVQEFTKSHIH